MRRCMTLFAMVLALIAFSATQAVAKDAGGGHGGGHGGGGGGGHGGYSGHGGYGDHGGYGGFNRDDGRYRWDNGRWWFWGPENQWILYDGEDQLQNDDEVYSVQRPIVKNFSGGPIKIVNPATNKVALSYTLNGNTYTIQPGYSQEIREDRAWVIEFSRGTDLEDAQYSLQSGVYTFTATDQGWELYRSEFPKTVAPKVAPPPVNPAPATPQPTKTVPPNPSPK